MKDKAKSSAALIKLKTQIVSLKKFLWAFLLLFFLVVYGYVLLAIHSDITQQPTQVQVSNNLKTTAMPAINQKVVQQLEQMSNNSVSVKALFNQGRQNPFQ